MQEPNRAGDASIAENAAVVILAELDRYINLVMHLTDAIEHAQQGNSNLNIPKVRRAAAPQLRKSARDVCACLAGLLNETGDPTVHEFAERLWEQSNEPEPVS